jgi:hypothetical protein
VGVMRLARLISGIMILLIFLSFFIVNAANAEDEIENFVEATFDIEFETGTDLNIEITIDALQLTTDETYTASEIKSAPDIKLGAFYLLLYQMLERQLEDVFPNAEFLNFSMPVFDGNTFNEQLNVKLTSSFFGLNDSVNAHNFINGVLDISAWINYSLNLQAEPGWNNTYNIVLGENLDYQRTNGILSGDTITWTLSNGDGNKPSRIAEIKIKKKNPTTEKLESEDIFLEFELDSKDPETTSLTSNVILKDVDIRPYNIIPSFISNLDFIPSDEQTIKSTIEESAFNQTLSIIFSWDNETTTDCILPYEIDNMNNNPPVKAMITDGDVDLQICGIPSRALFGLINSGANANISKADVNFGDDLNKIGYDYNVTLYLPDNLYLGQENIYTWNESISNFGEFESDNAVIYDEQEKNTVIVIEVTSTDLNLLSFFTGETELTFGLKSKETRNYNVTELPDEFSLPEKVSINYLNSDAFRVCVEEEVFSQEEINEFQKSEKTAFERKLRSVLYGLKINANINEDAFEKSLDWDGNILKMDADSPIKVASAAQSSYPIPFELGLLPPKFDIPTLKLNFTGIPDNEVTYKIIFPHEIRLSVSDSLNKSDVKKTRDGRQYIEITFSASEANLTVDVSCKITPSALFILGILTPCLVSLIITIILVIVIFIIRRKRRFKKAEAAPMIDEEEDLTGYEDEDYYIPPPPGSK